MSPRSLRTVPSESLRHQHAAARYRLTQRGRRSIASGRTLEAVSRKAYCPRCHGNKRAEYGKQIVAQVAQQLQREYGEKGFDKSSITRMMNIPSALNRSVIVLRLSPNSNQYRLLCGRCNNSTSTMNRTPLKIREIDEAGMKVFI